MIFIAAIAGVFGLLIGSFLNVVIYRVPIGMSIVRPIRFGASASHGASRRARACVCWH